MTCSRAFRIGLLVFVGPVGLGGQSIRFDDGLWWDGDAFQRRTMYSVDGTFSATAPAQVDSVVSLDALWIVPPFAEAHTHTIAYVRSRIDEFLRDGVFYAMVMNVDRSVIERNATWFNRQSSVDVNYTTAAVTAPDAHPMQIGMRNGRTIEELDGDWATVVESVADLDAKWSALSDANSDFVKAFLLYSERYHERRADPDVQVRYRGMDPVLMAPLVERAHADGLRVAAHVRTSHDFRVAVEAGADVIAHLPGFSMGPYSVDELDNAERTMETENPDWFRIRPEEARSAARQGMVVIPTVAGVGSVPEEVPGEIADGLRNAYAVRRDVVAYNLRILHESGVRIAIGSDAGEGSPVTEALGLEEFGVFSPTEIVVMLTENASRVTFPRRSVGRLSEGYEASFLALEADPTRDLSAIRSVRLRFKQGRFLDVR